MRQSNIRFGAVGLKGETAPREPIPTASVSFSLGEEVDTLRWMQEQVQGGRGIPLLEAEAIVRSLSIAMHGGQRIILPMLHLKEFDQYTTTHSLNVAVLAMALAEFLGLGPREVRAIGIAGLLHDIGKIKVPLEVLTKPGKLTPEERAVMNRHPVDGARLILEDERYLDLAAVVAYEHHVMLDGGGYPTFRYPRDCHAASKLVHVCDVYDALRTNRPYRDAWPADKALGYVTERVGTEFAPDVAAGFTRMMHAYEQRVTVLTDPAATFAVAAEAPA
jgi:putative nucleotidyltransferase with HDIG domain